MQRTRIRSHALCACAVAALSRLQHTLGRRQLDLCVCVCASCWVRSTMVAHRVADARAHQEKVLMRFGQSSWLHVRQRWLHDDDNDDTAVAAMADADRKGSELRVVSATKCVCGNFSFGLSPLLLCAGWLDGRWMNGRCG